MKKANGTTRKTLQTTPPEFSASEWRPGARSETGRNGEAENSGAALDGGGTVPPDPEVREKKKRRRLTSAYKLRILQEADSCTQSGQLGALLRREGLYSSQLQQWRRHYRQGAEQALQENRRGRKRIHSELEVENEKLKRQVQVLEGRLQQAETIIEVQKKISDLLGIQQPTDRREESAW